MTLPFPAVPRVLASVPDGVEIDTPPPLPPRGVPECDTPCLPQSLHTMVFSSFQTLVTSRPASMHAARPQSFAGATDHSMYVDTHPRNGPLLGNPLPSPKTSQEFIFGSQQKLDEMEWYWRNISRYGSQSLRTYMVARR